MNEDAKAAVLKVWKTRPTVWAECVFGDPVADIAILGCPAGQSFYEQADAFERLVDGVQPFEIAAIAGAHNAAEAIQGGISAQLLSLKNEWFDCKVSCIRNDPLWIRNAAQPIRGGRSGSPVINEKGAAIGMLCTAGGTTKEHTEGGPNPRLTNSLPGWLIGELLRWTSSLKLKEPI